MRSKRQQNLYNIQILSVLCVPKGRSGEGRLTLFSHKIQTTGTEETFMHFLFEIMWIESPDLFTMLQFV